MYFHMAKENHLSRERVKSLFLSFLEGIKKLVKNIISKLTVGGRKMGFVFLLIILFCLYWYLDYKKYEKSNYKAATGYKYAKVRFNKGFYGEFLSYNMLDQISGSKRILTNVYIPKENGGTTEIDVVMLHEKGIFVVESKNYSGWIFGNEKSKYWMQTFKTGQKERFYNPIWQNHTHIKHLSKALNIENPYFIKSIIAFSERCELKKIEVESRDIKVINRYKLIKTVKELISESAVNFSEKDINEWCEKLKKYTNVSEDVKANHINDVNGYKL